METKKLLFVLIAVVISVAVAASVITYSITKNNMKSGEIYIETDEYQTMMKYFEMEDIADVLANSYYTDVDTEKITVGALEGMVAALDDGYSRFYPEEDFNYFNAATSDSYVALGMLLRKDAGTGYVRVDHVFADTPAYDMNMNKGDLILSVDGRDTSDLDIDCAVNRIRGLEGTEVVLQVIPQDGKQVE
ncbi:MAG: PDZ domain-containing protein, partial [Oscillospiraceae bacterium]|nr:PDZ domain-containing protein [Oscillospiraceae bacterium]